MSRRSHVSRTGRKLCPICCWLREQRTEYSRGGDASHSAEHKVLLGPVDTSYHDLSDVYITGGTRNSPMKRAMKGCRALHLS